MKRLHRFLGYTFDYIARFIENSLTELEAWAKLSSEGR